MSSPIPAAAHDLDFASALQAAEAIRKKQISSLELTQRAFARIDKFNPQLNAFVYQTREEALTQAKKADEAQASGNSLGVFHGVPFNVKESFGVAGHPDTWGIPAFKDIKAPADSEAVSRLRDAGAILLGATNVPVNLADWQSYNPIYGATNNPWDLKRTPGGSSGGSAAALAAGLGYLSVGSDIGGSIRVPSHFCGLYGHKPTLNLVSTQGQVPAGVRDNPGFDTLLAVAGPMARSAADLNAALKILGGPANYDAKAWKWELPNPRATSLKNFRVGYVIDDSIAPPTPEMKTLLEKTISALDRAGAQLKPGWPAGFQIQTLLDTYKFLLFAFLFSVTPPEQQEAQRKAAAASQLPASSRNGALRRLAAPKFPPPRLPRPVAKLFQRRRRLPLASSLHSRVPSRSQRTARGASHRHLLRSAPLPRSIQLDRHSHANRLPRDNCSHRPNSRWLARRHPNHGSVLGRRHANKIRRAAIRRNRPLQATSRLRRLAVSLTLSSRRPQRSRGPP